jgi:hypothetical protein
MNVATITMPADEARQKFDEYRAALAGREETDEDRGILMGYQALAKGRAVLDLHAVFRACPPDAQGRPALAVARAHWKRCFLRLERDGSARFGQTRNDMLGYRRPAWHRYAMLPAGTVPTPLRPHDGRAAGSRHAIDLAALVPIIPPNLRPARALERYCVLFEAEWGPVPPVDPLLIRHLHGSLYAVLAAWALTPLERAVLAGRLADRP